MWNFGGRWEKGAGVVKKRNQKKQVSSAVVLLNLQNRIYSKGASSSPSRKRKMAHLQHIKYYIHTS